MAKYISSRKYLVLICMVLLLIYIAFYAQNSLSSVLACMVSNAKQPEKKVTVPEATEVKKIIVQEAIEVKKVVVPAVNDVKKDVVPEVNDVKKDVVPEASGLKKDVIDNTGAISYLLKYEKKLRSINEQVPIPADPNNPATITKFWQAAAMMDWYMSGKVRYVCKNQVAMGNWHICQDEPYTVKPPCLVYSFGINYDFSFDDAMERLGCEVHSFDPSMNKTDHKRRNNSYFHDMGLGGVNTDGFVARKDEYVTSRQVWKMRTVKAIMAALGHDNRVIDVFKMDIEGYEWAVLDNMIESGILKYIRQLIVEFHLFYDFPLREEYVFCYKTHTKLREMGFRESRLAVNTRIMNSNKYRLQGDSEHVNVYFNHLQL